MKIPPYRPNVASAATRFGGYTVRPNAKSVDFWEPGLNAPNNTQSVPYNQSNVYVEVQVGEYGTLKKIPLASQGDGYWRTNTPVANDNEPIYYRFINQAGEQVLDETQVVPLKDKGNFNRICANPKPGAASQGATVLVFRDSVRSKDEIDRFNRQGLERNHFNTFSPVKDATTANNDVLMPLIKQFGIANVEDRPLIGGDGQANPAIAERSKAAHLEDDGSAHGYWTSNLFQLNNKINGPRAFDQVAKDYLHAGARWTFDGAFVNEGFNGIHYQYNVLYGKNSPYIGWMDYGKLDAFPNAPLKPGILPVPLAPKGNFAVDDKAWNIRFKDAKGHYIKLDEAKDSRAVYFVETYDPRVQNARGERLPVTPETRLLFTHSQQSIQTFAFPVWGKELIAKAKARQTLKQEPDYARRQDAERHWKTSWQNFVFVSSAQDNSGYRWDGQRDVGKLNMRNPDVQHYLQQACRYWTDRIDRLYVQDTAPRVTNLAAMPSHGDLNTYAQGVYTRISALTAKQTGESGKAFPPLNGGQTDPVSAESIAQALEAYRTGLKKPAAKDAAGLLTHDLKTYFQPGSLPGPRMIQALMSQPDFETAITKGDRRWPLAVTQSAFQWVDNICKHAGFQPVAWTLRQVERLPYMRGPAFLDKLNKTLNDKLSPDLKKRLNDPVMAHLVYETVAQRVFISLMTGKYDPSRDLRELSADYYKHLPHAVAYPTLPYNASRLLNRFLIRGLKTNAINAETLNRAITEQIKGITPESAVVARHVLQQRGYGLHWRIDAMKDIGDIDSVRNITGLAPQARRKKLIEEVDFAKQTLGDIVKQVRSVFPQSIVTAELTDFNKFDAPDTKKEDQIQPFLFNRIFDGGVVNGMPNYQWMYSSAHRLVRMSPDELAGESPIDGHLGVSTFITDKVADAMHTIPFENALYFQNMNANHDKSTVINGLIGHPILSQYDNKTWLGIQHTHQDKNAGSAPMVLHELSVLSDHLGSLTDKLTKSQLQKAVGIIQTQLNNPDFLNSIKTPLLDTFRDHGGPRYNSKYNVSVPVEAKTEFADNLFAKLSANQLGLNEEDKQAFQKAFTTLLCEHSELKGRRAMISNAVEELAKTTSDFSLIKNAIADSFFRLEQAHGQWLAYRPLDLLIPQLMEDALKHNPANSVLRNAAQRQALGNTLYLHLLTPALEQYQRIAAVQTAIPGNPTFYLPDLYGETGGEGPKNMYLGNRDLIRHDRLSDPAFKVLKDYQASLATIISQRSRLQVLNDGQVILPLNPKLMSQDEQKKFDAQHVLPIIRDNGRDQAICLINVSKTETNWKSVTDALPNDSNYPEVHNTETTVNDYKLDLSKIGIAPGTRYKALNDNKEYVVNSHHQLVSASNPNQGIDIHINETLVRVAV